MFSCITGYIYITLFNINSKIGPCPPRDDYTKENIQINLLYTKITYYYDFYVRICI